MRKPVKEIENVLQNHGYSINNLYVMLWRRSSLKHFAVKLAFKSSGLQYFWNPHDHVNVKAYSANGEGFYVYAPR